MINRYVVFRSFDKNRQICKEYLELVIENVIILGHLMADTSSKRQKIYIFSEMSHIYLILSKNIMFTYLIISRERHFQLKVLPYVPRVKYFTAQ